MRRRSIFPFNPTHLKTTLPQVITHLGRERPRDMKLVSYEKCWESRRVRPRGFREEGDLLVLRQPMWDPVGPVKCLWWGMGSLRHGEAVVW